MAEIKNFQEYLERQAALDKEQENAKISALMRLIPEEMRIDLHTHSRYSDGALPVEDIIDTAIKRGIRYVAITDHYHMITSNYRENEKIKEYANNIMDLRQKFRDKINILVGVEVDLKKHNPPVEELNNLDLILFENIGYNPAETKPEDLIGFKKNLNAHIGLAHYNFDGNPGHQDELLSALKEGGIFVELTCHKPPMSKEGYHFENAEDFFRKLKGTTVPISIGSDSHLGELGSIQDALLFVMRNKLYGNLLTKNLSKRK